MKKRKIFGLFLLALGIIFLANSFSNITGFVVVEQVSRNISGVISLLFVIVGALILVSREKLSLLEKILSIIPHRISIPAYSSVKEGIENTEEASPFAVSGLGYFVYVKTKKEAADIANYLIGAGGRRIYVERGAEKILGKRARSLDIKKLESIKDIIEKSRIERIGFGSREYETKTGRAWEKEALYHRFHPTLGINYLHYSVSYSPKGSKTKKEIHILIKKD